MNTKFYSNKSRSFGVLLLVSSLIVIIIFALPFWFSDNYPLVFSIIIGFLTVLSLGLFLWIWIATFYVIDDDKLIAKSGPLIWRIPIHEISFVRLNQETIGGTWKLTLSWRCIEIKYKKNRAIFISPNNENEFLEKLLAINPRIEVKQK